MSQPSLPQLHQFLLDHFNTEELKDLCLNLFVEYEDLGGDGRSGKARELVQLMKRHGQLEHFCAILSQARPTAYRSAFSQSPQVPLPIPRPKRDPRQVFISHAHQDAAFAQRLARDLRTRGIPVWIAPDSIQVGEQWPEAIDRGLEESGVVVVALTPNALTSAWVRKETFAAIHLESLGRITFIPLDVAACEPPILWRTYQFAPFRRDYAVGLNDLLARLLGVSNRRIHEKTGIELIRIPAGPFLYGSSDADTMAFDDEKPQRTVDLPEYWIGRYPVTNRDYKRFLDATPNHGVPFFDADWARPYNWDAKSRGYPANKADHPVVLVSWGDAQAFCDWAGLILPTEEQWEKAARGTDGLIWPWGDKEPTADHCNFNRNIGGTTPVGKYSPRGDSPRGCADMAGNVWEWTGSWYSERSRRALRGGSWVSNDQNTRAAYRDDNSPDDWLSIVGFRVAELLSDPGF